MPTLHPAAAGGAHALVATALARKQQPEQAAVHWMKTVILFPGDDALTAESLVNAARQLEQLGRDSEAVSLLQETMRDYASTAAAAEAQLYLNRLQPRQ